MSHPSDQTLTMCSINVHLIILLSLLLSTADCTSLLICWWNWPLEHWGQAWFVCAVGWKVFCHHYHPIGSGLHSSHCWFFPGISMCWCWTIPLNILQPQWARPCLGAILLSGWVIVFLNIKKLEVLASMSTI